MSDNIVEITENTNYSIAIDTSLVQNNNNVVIELVDTNNVDVINNSTVLVSDLPQGYPLSWTVGNLPVSRVSGLDINGGNYINVIDSSGIYIISATGLQPSGNYSPVGHNHASSDITDFTLSVSGLLPVKNISAGNGIGIVNSSGDFNVSVTGTFGLTGEQVDDRISNLLVDGDYVHLNYNDLTDKLTISVTGLQPSGNYSLVGHQHLIGDVSGLQNSLDSKQPSGAYASSIHYHNSSDIIDFNNSVDARIVLANLQPSGNYSLVGHSHLSNDIIDFSSAVSGILPVKNISSGSGINITNNNGDFTVAVTGQFGLTGEQVDDRVNDLLVGINNIVLSYDDNLDKLVIGTSGLQPSGNYSVIGHSHSISDVSGLQNILDSKQPSGSYSPLIHSHTSNDITNFSSSVNSLVSGIYAPLNNPNFSGVPTAPTAPSGTNNSQIANTQFVRSEISNLVNSAPSTLDTLNELATALGNDPNFATTIASGLAGKASLVHSHTSSDITNFNSSVSGLLPITSIAASSGIVVSNSGTTYNIASSGLAFTSGANFDNLSLSGIPVSVSGHNHSYTDITNWASGIENEVSTLLVAGNYINLNYDNIADTLTISASGLQPSGNYANSVHSHGNISSSGTIGSTSGLLVTTTSNGALTTSSEISSSYITNFNSSVSGLLPSISGSGYVSSNFANNIYSISVTGLQPSGNYSLAGHSHSSSDITDFNSAVSGLIPVKHIVSGTDISVTNVSGIYTINSTVNTVSEAGSLVTTVFNKTGSPIPKMSAVYIDGGQGDTPTVALAIATGDPTSAGTYGLTFETIPNMSTGKVVVFGGLTGLNTDQFNPTAPHGDVNGQVLYLSPTTPGGLTLTKPIAPNHMVAVGTIVRTHQNQGVIEVRVQNGFELEELHNVAISGVTNGQFLQYNGSGLWVPSSSGNFTSLSVNNINVVLDSDNRLPSFPDGSQALVTYKSDNSIGPASENDTIVGFFGGNPPIIGDHLGIISISQNQGIRIDNSGILLANDNGFIRFSDSTVQTSAWTGNISSSQVTDFNSSVSGLLPVTNITGGSNITVSQSGTIYTVAVTGSLGLTTEEVDDRVSNLLVAGSGISLNYDDSLNSLTVAVSGLSNTINIGNGSGNVISFSTSETLNVVGSGSTTVAYNDTTNTINIGSPSLIREYELISSTKSAFTVTGGYALNNLDVYHNGIKLLASGDYTATNGSTFDLIQPAVSGDVVEWLGYSVVPRHQLILGEVRSDTVGNINYLGRAVAGSPEASGVWTIKRYTVADNGIDITTATASNAIWNNRLTETYL